MKFIFTLDFLELGFLGICLIIAAVCFIGALIDVFTKNWRYKHFKCPKCGHMRENGHCGHFRNDKCDCKYYYKKRSK